jgi:hydrogenase maturation protein HypF
MISGAVQGVGFRPFIFHLAQDLKLTGYVRNSPAGVVMEAEGPLPQLKSFLRRIPDEKPPHSFIQNFQYVFLDVEGYEDFRIEESDTEALRTAIVLPDIATCPECLKEIFNPRDRRYLYPFTNCTHCGPRFSIIEGLPYDRIHTSMKEFRMCPACRHEYDDPANRRFHAQPNACPDCGPHLELWDAEGNVIAARHKAVVRAVKAIRAGQIVAVKGIGGFHLFADPHNEDSVRLLRKRKHREEKPFALMFPSLASIEEQCDVSSEEKTLLQSGESPIVLLSRKKGSRRFEAVVPSVAPGNPYLGAMLPYSPLHHILMRELGKAVVATSGNLAEEPICIDEGEALHRLAGIADEFLVHNRPIVRSIDDSVVRSLMGRPLVIRRARGYAPLPVVVKGEGQNILATGGHLKNTVALKIKHNVFISQHIGDLQTKQSLEAFQKTVESMEKLYVADPRRIACDMHPDYLSTKFAQSTQKPLERIQHHHAHIAACMAENQIEGKVLGIVWDGAGFGPDGTVWGGEFLKASIASYERAAHFKTFALPGGDKVAIEPRRAAIAILYNLSDGSLEGFDDLAPVKAFPPEELDILKNMMIKNINAPLTSSVGRLFDAVASFLDINQTLRFEGQAAMGVEYILQDADTDAQYDFIVEEEGEKCFILDWTPMFIRIIKDIRGGTDKKFISAKFHNTLVEMAVDIAKRIGKEKVVLSGGCFQNAYLIERMVRRMKEEGFKPYWHQLVPPNDGGIALGQAVCAVRRMAQKK